MLLTLTAHSLCSSFLYEARTSMIDALLTGPHTPLSYIPLPPRLTACPLAAELERSTYPCHSSSLSCPLGPLTSTRRARHPLLGFTSIHTRSRCPIHSPSFRILGLLHPFLFIPGLRRRRAMPHRHAQANDGSSTRNGHLCLLYRFPFRSPTWWQEHLSHRLCSGEATRLDTTSSTQASSRCCSAVRGKARAFRITPMEIPLRGFLQSLDRLECWRSTSRCVCSHSDCKNVVKMSPDRGEN